MKKHIKRCLTYAEEKTLQDLFFLKILVAIIAILILTIGVLCIIHVDQVCKQQIDTLDQLNYIRQAIEDPVEQVTTEEAIQSTSLGDFTVTHYCSCPICCGKSADGITATGTVAMEGRTIAVDPEVIPLGSEVLIDGQVYIAEDVGGSIKGNKIDIFVNSHQEAVQRGKIQREVRVVS